MGCARGCLAGRASTLGRFPGPFGSKSSGQPFICLPMAPPSALGYKYIPEATPVFRLFVAVGGSASIGE